MHKSLYSGDFVSIGDKFYRVGGIEPFEYRTGEEATAIFSAVASGGGTSGFINVTELEPDDNPRHLFWVVPGVKDGMDYFIKIPTGTNRFGTDVSKGIGFIDNIMSPYYAPNSDFGFYLIEDYYPAIEARNNTGVAITPKVYFTGFKYDLNDIKNSAIIQSLRLGRIPFKRVTLGGIKL